MAVGGNQRGRTFFKQHVRMIFTVVVGEGKSGNSRAEAWLPHVMDDVCTHVYIRTLTNLGIITFLQGWDEIGSDKIEGKYSSRAAQLYKKQLEKDVHAAMSGVSLTRVDGATPGSPTFEDASLSPKASAEAKKPAITKSKATAAATVGVKSAAAGRPRAAGARGVRGGKKGGLVVKKMSKTVDESLFEQAPEVAREEVPAAQVDDFVEKDDFEFVDASESAALQSSRFTMDVLEDKVESTRRGKDGHVQLDMNDDFFSNPIGSGVSSSVTQEPKSPTGIIGGAARKSSFGKKPSAAPGAADDSSSAQQRFGNAKSISSSSYHNEGGENDYERQAKMAQFQGSAAISSDAYFGRESRDMDDLNGDFVSKMSMTARQDVEHLRAIAGEAKNQLSRFAQNFMRDLQGM